ncbi:hypothetical protein [Saccharothrix xinjiangensis]|uniref:Uncharacterized protein n=1 Tax=Saccharothrix xinjiangensis TaxID=204798 RepID=A0ABV9YFQ8_9PSEU
MLPRSLFCRDRPDGVDLVRLRLESTTPGVRPVRVVAVDDVRDHTPAVKAQIG